MKRIFWGVALMAAPLLAFSLAFPAGPAWGLSPAWAAGLPLAWAAFVSVIIGVPGPLLSLSLCLPYSAWSLLYCSNRAYSPRPLAMDALDLLAAAALFLSVLALSRLKSRGARLILAFAVFIPGMLLHAALGPLAALALAAFSASLAALTKARGEAGT